MDLRGHGGGSQDFAKKLARQQNAIGDIPKVWSELKGGLNEFGDFLADFRAERGFDYIVLAMVRYFQELCSSSVEALQGNVALAGKLPVVEQRFLLKGRGRLTINAYVALPDGDVWILRICNGEDRRQALRRATEWRNKFKIRELPVLVNDEGNMIS
jgi:hypothetical protein